MLYNDESSCLGMGFLKLQLPEERPSRSLQDRGSQAEAWEPANLGLTKSGVHHEIVFDQRSIVLWMGSF